MTSLSLYQQIMLWFLPVLFAITVHEIAHGFVALKYGDTTAKRAGRLTLNPFKHVSPVGSILVPGMFLYAASFIFGWAKPVPVVQSQLNNPKKDMVLVALAGPVSNLIMSILWALIIKLGVLIIEIYPLLAEIMILMGAAGVFINSAIMMLNLLPLPPLDGGRILVGILPEKYSELLCRIEPWGLPILLILIFSGVIGKLIWPMMILGMAIATHICALPVGLLTSALKLLFN